MSDIRRLGDGYEPHVDERSGRLIYSLPVDSGFTSTSVSFEIGKEDLAVLLADPYRRAALEAVAHTVLQRAMLPGGAPFTPAGFDALVRRMLHSTAPELEADLDRIGREHNIVLRVYIDRAMSRNLGADQPDGSEGRG